MRLGFTTRVLGQDLKSHDSRRWQHDPHLSVSLLYLRDVFGYLDRQNIRVYRLAADLAPYISHPDLPQFHHQIAECELELAAAGQLARDLGLRLSFHAPLSTVLNTPAEARADQAAADLTALAGILDAMGLGPEAVVVTHVGGAYEDRCKARERFAARFLSLPAAVQRRLALEHDDQQFSVADLAWLHEHTGAPLVFDRLHFQCYNPEGLSEMEALATCLHTWPGAVQRPPGNQRSPGGVTPKIHFSSPRTAMHLMEQRDAESGRVVRTLRAPQPTEHADFIDPFAFIAFWQAAQTAGLPDFDVLLEGGGHDLAVLRLREHLAAYAPEVRMEVQMNDKIYPTPDHQPPTTDRQSRWQRSAGGGQ